MEPALKQRLLGAAVLVALAVVFLPLLVMDPAPDSGASRVPLRVPNAPAEANGDTRTFDLPLATPADTQAPVTATPVEPPAGATPAAAPAGPTTAAGDYAVNFGSYATTTDAARVVAALAAARLPAYQEPTTLGTRTVYRVRIGPYPTSADAETARLAAARVRSDVNAKVVVLDAATPSAAAAVAQTTALPATPAAKPVALPPTTPATTVATAPRTAATTPATTVTAGTDRTTPAASEPPRPAAPPVPPSPTTAPAAAGVGFAVQLGAFANADEATRLRDRVRAAGFSAFVEQVNTDRGTLSRVRVGPVPDRAQADALRAQVAAKVGVSGIVRQHP